MKTYNKLVRDRILERIEKEGTKYSSRVLSEEEYKEELLKKLIEEAGETVDAAKNAGDLPMELGDVMEVIEAIAAAFGLPMEDVMRVKAERQESRGAFTKRLFLESTD